MQKNNNAMGSNGSLYMSRIYQMTANNFATENYYINMFEEADLFDTLNICTPYTMTLKTYLKHLWYGIM